MRSRKRSTMLLVSMGACMLFGAILLFVLWGPRCNVHSDLMTKEEVPILYGFVVQDKRYREAYEKFPNANSVVHGGCVMTPSSPQYETVYVCRSCREAESRVLKIIESSDKAESPTGDRHATSVNDANKDG